jgi:hypothetical protein
MRITRGQLRRLVREEASRLAEGPRGNPQSEPEFGDLLDALEALRRKGFSADEVMRTALELAPRGR